MTFLAVQEASEAFSHPALLRKDILQKTIVGASLIKTQAVTQFFRSCYPHPHFGNNSAVQVYSVIRVVNITCHPLRIASLDLKCKCFALSYFDCTRGAVLVLNAALVPSPVWITVSKMFVRCNRFRPFRMCLWLQTHAFNLYAEYRSNKACHDTTFCKVFKKNNNQRGSGQLYFLKNWTPLKEFRNKISFPFEIKLNPFDIIFLIFPKTCILTC